MFATWLDTDATTSQDSRWAKTGEQTLRVVPVKRFKNAAGLGT